MTSTAAPRRARLLRAVTALGAAGLLAAGPLAGVANAASTGRIVNVQVGEPASSDGGPVVTAVFEATSLPTGVTLDPASLVASVNGKTVPATAEPVGATATPVSRTAVMALDTSGSMQGDRLVAAKKAATTFLDTVPTDVKVGLVTFSDKVTVAVPPTTDRAAVKTAVAAATAQGGTALYDASATAAKTAGTRGLRQVLLLSDGEDDGSSRTTLSQAVAAIKSSGATFDAVGLSANDIQTKILTQLTVAGNGTLTTTANAAALSTVFAQTAQSIGNQLAVTVRVPKALAASASQLTLAAKAGEQTVTDTVFVPLKGFTGVPTPSARPNVSGPQPVQPQTGFLASVGLSTSPWVLWSAVGALTVGLLGFMLVGLRALMPKRLDGISRSMSVYSLAGRKPQKKAEVSTSTALGDNAVARTAVDFADKVVAKRDLEGMLGHRLETAGVAFKPGEWALLHIGIALGLGLLLLMLSSGSIVAGLAGVLVGAIAPWMYLGFKANRRRRAFNTQLADTLSLMAGSLRAGYSLPQAVDTVVRQGTEPVATEFNRALVEARLGVPIEDALDGVAERMDSVDWAWAVMAIRIQREVGGNLAEVLDNVSATLRERARLKRQVQVLSAEGRLSAWVVGVLPLVFALYLLIVRPDYLAQLWSSALGLVMVAVAVLLMLVGVVWLRKIVNVEV